MGWKLRLRRRRPEDSGPSPDARRESEAPLSGAISLTEGQRRHLEIAFRSLLTEAEETRARLLGLNRDGTDPPRWVREVANELEPLMRDIQRAATALELSLDRDEIPLHREVAAWASASWSLILDCRPAALRGYGPVDEYVARLLAPAIKRMAARLMHIQSVTEAGAADNDDVGSRDR